MDSRLRPRRSLHQAHPRTSPERDWSSPRPMTASPRESSSPGWTSRPYRTGDERQLVRLYRQAGVVEPTVEHWRWKLGHGGPVDHVFLAEVAGEPVFQYAGIPTRFQFRGRIRTAMVSVDTLTRPDHRRRGLLTRGLRRGLRVLARPGRPLRRGPPQPAMGLADSRVGLASGGDSSLVGAHPEPSVPGGRADPRSPFCRGALLGEGIGGPGR